MYFHEIAGELKTYMDPTGRGGDFVIALVGDTLRDPMTEEEQQMDLNDESIPLQAGCLSICLTRFSKEKNTYQRLAPA